MTRKLSAPRGAHRAALIGLLALGAALLAALTLSPKADAAFTTAPCQGLDITGRGASFARDAHNAFTVNFENSFCPGGPTITYEALGSGAGLQSVGVREGANATGANSRNQVPRFGMTDDPPSTTQTNDINRGTDDPGDEDRIHVIPAAVGAVAPLVNFPNGCDVNGLLDANKTDSQDNNGDTVPDGTVRVRFTKDKFERMWAKDGTADTWTELFPELETQGAPCNVAIIRVVRFDRSGTTYTLKDYLDKLNTSRGWLSAALTDDNRDWPTDGAVQDAGPRADCAGATGPGPAPDATDQLTSGCSNGNGSLVSKVISTDSSVGYSDISTARTASPSLAITPRANAAAGFDNDTYWTQIQNGSNAFTEPTASPNGFRTDGPKGSNCGSTTFQNVPASTLDSWATTSGVNSPNGYGICTLTYGLLFDDYAKAYGLLPNQASEEQKARSVKDYWTSIMSQNGQAVLFGQDYSPLPAGIRAVATAGVNAVSYGEDAGTTPPVVNPPVVNPPVVNPPGPPSNRFTIPRTALSSRTGGVTFSIRVPGRGRIVVGGRNGRLKVGGISRTLTRAGTYKLTIKPGKAAKRKLRRSRSGRLKVRFTFKFTPQGGTTRRVTRTVTLKLRKPRARR